jgi:hypothetical protein
MSIAVTWDNDSHRIVCNIFDREWTWDDFQAAKAQSYAMVAAEDHPVAIVFVVPSDVLIPPNFVSQMSASLRQTGERNSVILLVGGNPYLRALLNVLESVAGRSGRLLQTFDSLNQARKWAAEWERGVAETGAKA